MTFKGSVRGKGGAEAAIAEAEGASELLTAVPTVATVVEQGVEDAERAVSDLVAYGERAERLASMHAEEGEAEPGAAPSMSDALSSLVMEETEDEEQRLGELREEEAELTVRISDSLGQMQDGTLGEGDLLRAGEGILEARRRLAEIYREAEEIFRNVVQSLEGARARVSREDEGDYEDYLAYMRANAEDIADFAEANSGQIAALESLPGDMARRAVDAERHEQELRAEVEAAIGAVDGRLETGGAVSRSVFEGSPLAGRLSGRPAEDMAAFLAGDASELSGRNIRTVRWLQEHEEQLAASGIMFELERSARGRPTGAYTLVNLRFIPESVSDGDIDMLSARLGGARESFEAGDTDAAQEAAAAVSAYLDLQRAIALGGARLTEEERRLVSNASETARAALRDGDSGGALDASSAALQVIQCSLGVHELGSRLPQETLQAIDRRRRAAIGLMLDGEYERAGMLLLALNNYASAAAQHAASEEAAASAGRMRMIISPERCALFFDDAGRFSAGVFERRTGVSYEEYRDRGGEERGIGLVIAAAHRRAAGSFGDAMERLDAVMDAAEAGESVEPDAFAGVGQLIRMGHGASLQAQQLRQIAVGYVRDGRRPTERVTLEGQEEGTIRIQDAITRYGAVPTALALDLTAEGNIVSPVAREEMLPQQEDVERGRRTVMLRTGGVFFAVAAADMEAVEREERRRRVASRSAAEAAAGLLGGYEMQATFERGVLLSLGDVREMRESLDDAARQARSAGRSEFMGHSRIPERVSLSVERARDSARQVMDEGEIPSAPTEEGVLGRAGDRLDDAAGRYHREADGAFRRGVALIAATAPSMLDVRDGRIVFRDAGRAREYARLQDDLMGLFYVGPMRTLFEREEREEALGRLHDVLDDRETGDPIEQRVVMGNGVYSPDAGTWHENIESSEVADTVLEARRLADDRGLDPYHMSEGELGALVDEARGRARSYRSSTVARAYIQEMEAVAEAPIRLEESLQRYAVRLQERSNFEGMRMRETLRNYVIASELAVAGIGLAVIGLPEAIGVLVGGGATGSVGSLVLSYALASGSVLFSGAGIYGSVMSSVDYVRMNDMAWDALERGDYATYRMAHEQMTNILGMQVLNTVVMGAGGGAARMGMRATTVAAERGLNGLAATYLRSWSGAGSLALRGAEGYGLYVMTDHALRSAREQDRRGDHVGAWTTRIMAIAPLAHMTLAHGAGYVSARAQARRHTLLTERARELEASLRRQGADMDVVLEAVNLFDRRYEEGGGIGGTRPVTDEHLAAVQRRIAAGESEADALVAVAMERTGRVPREAIREEAVPNTQEGEITVEASEGVIVPEELPAEAEHTAPALEPARERIARELPIARDEADRQHIEPGTERRLTDPEEVSQCLSDIDARAREIVAGPDSYDQYGGMSYDGAWARSAADIAAERGFNPLDLIPHIPSRQRDTLRAELNYRGQFRQLPPVAREVATPVAGEDIAAPPRPETPAVAAPESAGGRNVAEIVESVGSEMVLPIESHTLPLMDVAEGPLIMRIARTLYRAYSQGRTGEIPSDIRPLSEAEMGIISEDPLFSNALSRLRQIGDRGARRDAIVQLAEEIYVRRQQESLRRVGGDGIESEVADVARDLAQFIYSRELPSGQTMRRAEFEAARDRVMLDARARVRPGDRPVINAETIAWEAETLVRQHVARGQAEVTVREAAPSGPEMIPERTLAREIGPAARPETLQIARDLDQMLLLDPSLLPPELRARAATPEYRHALQNIETAVAAGADRVVAIAQEARIISIDRFVQAQSTPARRAVEHRAGDIVREAASGGRRVSADEARAQAAAELADSNSGIRLETMGLSDSALTRAREIYTERFGSGDAWMASSERLVPPEARREAAVAEERAAEQPAEVAVGDREARGAERERRRPSLRDAEHPSIERQAYERSMRALEDALIDRDIEGAVAADSERLLSRRHGQEEPRPPAWRTPEPITAEHLSRVEELISGDPEHGRPRMSEADAIIQVARELNEGGARSPEPRRAEPMSVDMVRYRSREVELTSRSLDGEIDINVSMTADGLLRTLYGVEPARGRAPEQITRGQLRARVDALMSEPGREGMSELDALIEIARSMNETEPPGPGRGPGGGPGLRVVEREGPAEAPAREEVPPSRGGGPEARAGREAPVSERLDMVARGRELRENPETLAELAFRYATAEEGARPEIIGDLPPLARRAVEQLASDPVFRRISETIARRAGSPERSLQSFRDMYPTRFGTGLRDSAERAAGWMAPRAEAAEARLARTGTDDVTGGLVRHGGEQEVPGRLETYAMMGERDIPPAVVERLASDYNSGMNTPDVAEMRGLLGERGGGARPSREHVNVREAAQTALELRMPQSRDELSPTARSLLDQAMELGQALRSPNERVRAAARANLDAMEPGPMRDALEYMLTTGSEFEANRPTSGSHPSDYQLLIAEMLGRRVREEAGGTATSGASMGRIAELGQLARELRRSEGTPYEGRRRESFSQMAAQFTPEEAILFGRAYRAAGSPAEPGRVGIVERTTPRVAGTEERVVPPEARDSAVRREQAETEQRAAVGDGGMATPAPETAEPPRVVDIGEGVERRIARIEPLIAGRQRSLTDEGILEHEFGGRGIEDVRPEELLALAQRREEQGRITIRTEPGGGSLFRDAAERDAAAASQFAEARHLRDMAGRRRAEIEERRFVMDVEAELVGGRRIGDATSRELYRVAEIFERRAEVFSEGAPERGMLLETAGRVREMAAERESAAPDIRIAVPDAPPRSEAAGLEGQLDRIYRMLNDAEFGRNIEEARALREQASRLELQHMQEDPALNRELDGLNRSSTPEEYTRELSRRYWSAIMNRRAAENPTLILTDDSSLINFFRNRARSEAEVWFYEGLLRSRGGPVPEAELNRVAAQDQIAPVAERPAREAPRPIGVWDRIRGRRERVDAVSESLSRRLNVSQEEFGRLHVGVLVGVDGRPVVSGFDVLAGGTRPDETVFHQARNVFVLDVGGARVPITTSATGDALAAALRLPRFDRTPGRTAPARQWEATAGRIDNNPQLEVAVSNLPADRVLGERHRERIREAARVLDALSDPELPMGEVPREYRDAVTQLRRRFQWRPESEQRVRDRAAFIAELAAGLQHLREVSGGMGPYR